MIHVNRARAQLDGVRGVLRLDVRAAERGGGGRGMDRRGGFRGEHAGARQRVGSSGRRDGREHVGHHAWQARVSNAWEPGIRYATPIRRGGSAVMYDGSVRFCGWFPSTDDPPRRLKLRRYYGRGLPAPM